VNIRPIGGGGGVIGIHPSNDLSAQRSPVKRVSTSQLPPPQIGVGFSKSIIPSGGGGGCSSGDETGSPVQKCYSTEELCNEISNLEGLMKDLNAITASEFQC
jgi:neogenin